MLISKLTSHIIMTNLTANWMHGLSVYYKSMWECRQVKGATKLSCFINKELPITWTGTFRRSMMSIMAGIDFSRGSVYLKKIMKITSFWLCVDRWFAWEQLVLKIYAITLINRDFIYAINLQILATCMPIKCLPKWWRMQIGLSNGHQCGINFASVELEVNSTDRF